MQPRFLTSHAQCLGAALLVTVVVGCGGPTAVATTPEARTPPDRCVIALRFVSDEDTVAESAPAEGRPVPPTTEVSLVRICDQNGRIVTSLGAMSGVCQHETETPGTLLAARCWWPGQEAVALRAVREGERVVVFALDDDGQGDAHALGSVELPPGSHIDVLAPGRQLAEPPES